MTRKSPIVTAVKALRETFKQGRHSTGDRSLARRQPTERNPWPKCPACFHRNAPEDYCQACGHCPACCEKCDRCGRCVMRCPGHPAGDGDE